MKHISHLLLLVCCHCNYCFHCCVSILFIIAAAGCDTKAALNYVQSLFHVEVFENCLPPIILHHQLYSIVHSRTVVDKELVSSGICLFLYKYIFTDIYLSHCYTIAWDRLSNQFFCLCMYVCMYVCMCVCVCLWARLRSHFSTDLHEIW